jgi:RNA polymerase primary sigma factor
MITVKTVTELLPLPEPEDESASLAAINDPLQIALLAVAKLREHGYSSYIPLDRATQVEVGQSDEVASEEPASNVVDIRDFQSQKRPKERRRGPDGAFEDLVDSIREIPPLRPGEEAALAKRIEAGDPQAKQRMVEAHLELVVTVIRMNSQRGKAINSDLMSEGVLGLHEAFGKYDFEKGKFKTIAYFYVRKNVLQAFSKTEQLIIVPRDTRGDASKIRQAEETLIQKLGRMPVAEDIAAVTGFRVGRVNTVKRRMAPLKSLQEPVGKYDDAEFGDFIEDEAQMDPEEAIVEGMNLMALLKDLPEALDTLDERERQILSLRYSDGEGTMTQSEVGKRLGISGTYAGRLESSALEKLRQDLSAYRP